MSSKFVSLYGIVVLLTVLFFSVLPGLEMLSWHELLLSKLLNQTPVLLCLGYLWFKRDRVRDTTGFYLIISFLVLNVVAEVHYYLIPNNMLGPVNFLNTIIGYMVLIALYIHMRVHVKGQAGRSRLLIYAVLACLLLILNYGVALKNTYNNYFGHSQWLLWGAILSMIASIIAVAMSFFVERPFSRNWYKLVFGTIAMIFQEVLLYYSFFLFKGSYIFTYTIGKLFFSVGLLLIVEVSMRKCLYRRDMTPYRKK